LSTREEGDVGDFILNFLAHVFESIAGGLSNTERKHIWAAMMGTAVLVIGMLLAIYLNMAS
jgi:primosomal protein N'